MKKTMKRVCTLVLSAAMVFGLSTPTTKKVVNTDSVVFAEEKYDGEFVYQNRTYRYRNEGSTNIALVTISSGGEVTLPSYVNIEGKRRKVTALADSFGDWMTFSNVGIPNTVTSIGHYVFYGTKMNKLVISSNLETMGVCFLCNGSVNYVSCDSYKIKKIEGIPFYKAKSPKKIIFGDWLIKYEFDDNDTVLDLSTSDMQDVKHVQRNHIINFGEKVNTLKLGKNTELLDIDYYGDWCFRNIKNVYINGRPVICSGPYDEVPSEIKNNYDFFQYSKFVLNYSADKGDYVLNSLGIKSYGANAAKYKGTLKPLEEYRIAKKVHDYIAKNYKYNYGVTGTWDQVFNCHTETKCQFDAEMYAFLLERFGIC